MPNDDENKPELLSQLESDMSHHSRFQAIIPRPPFNFINRSFGIALMYIILGCVALYSMFNLFITHVLRLKVETAVVSAVMEPVTAPLNGYITQIFVAPGYEIKQGEPLLTIENIELERALQLAQIGVKESEIEVNYYHQLIINEHRRLKIYRQIGNDRLQTASVLVQISRQDQARAYEQLQRVTALYKKKYLSPEDWENVKTRHQNTMEALKNATIKQKLNRHALAATRHGYYFTGNKLEGIEHDLMAKYESVQEQVAVERAKVLLYQDLREKMRLRAPFDAKISQVLKSVGNTTDEKTALILLEKTTAPKTIIAYLTQEEIIHIGASSQVKIYVPSTGKSYRGKIEEMNRTDGFVDIMNAQYRWRDFQIDRSAKITISLLPADQAAFDQETVSGMPLSVYFKRHWTL